jgi:L-ascorbate metabolism protein UlaG (beta-lactamase superfamily)
VDLQFFGANCVVFSNKALRLVIDDNLAELGTQSVTKADDIAAFTGAHGLPKHEPKLVIDGPGEYELSGLSILGIAARGSMDPEDTHKATMYKVMTEDMSYLITGHIFPDLNDSQLETIGMVDVMIVPVGNMGYTLDPAGALKLIRKVEPKIAIPTHFADETLHYPVDQLEFDQVLKGLAMEPKETTVKYRYKPGELGDTTQLVVLTRG